MVLTVGLNLNEMTKISASRINIFDPDYIFSRIYF